MKQAVGVTLCVNAVALLFCGCGTVRYDHARFNERFAAGDYEAAFNAAGGPGLLECSAQDERSLLPLLQGATAKQAGLDFGCSRELLDVPDETYSLMLDASLAASTADTLASILAGDRSLPYRGETYDGVMIHTYKALDCLALGDWNGGRVELNRASERQRQASEHFAREIAKQREAIEKKQSEIGRKNLDIDKTVANQETHDRILAMSSNLDRWKAYPDFVNPFTTYVHGLFFFLNAEDQGDYEKASHSFKQVYGMTDAGVAAEDLEMVENILFGKSSRATLKPVVWVVFENGLGPLREELRIDVPLFLANVRAVPWVGIALPQLKFRDQAYSCLHIKSGTEMLAKTEALASMDSVIASELKKDIRGIATRAILGALVKAYSQYLVYRKLGVDEAKLAAFVQFLTTKADTRIWSALPKDVQVARTSLPDDRRLRITSPNGEELLRVELTEARFNVLHVKIPRRGTRPTYHVIASNE